MTGSLACVRGGKEGVVEKLGRRSSSSSDGLDADHVDELDEIGPLGCHDRPGARLPDEARWPTVAAGLMESDEMGEHEHDEHCGHAHKATPEVAATLVANHRAFLGFLERRVGSRAVAEDILQDAFVRSIDKVSALRDQEAIVPWFYRVLRNAIVDYQRRRSTASKALADFAVELETEQSGTETHGAVCQCVKTLTETLKPEYAEALRRVEIEGVAVKDYAAEAGITSNNAGVRVFRARDALRKQVQRSCGTCATHGCVDCTCGATA